jgi:hypothetical protein
VEVAVDTLSVEVRDFVVTASYYYVTILSYFWLPTNLT